MTISFTTTPFLLPLQSSGTNGNFAIREKNQRKKNAELPEDEGSFAEDDDEGLIGEEATKWT